MASVTVNQLSALIDFLESNQELALGYCNRSKEGRSQARRLWEQCSTVLNSVSANCVQKTPDQWRLYYNEYKSKLLKKIKMEKAEISATGGGPSRSAKLTPIRERLYDLLGRDVGEPLPGVSHNPLVVSQSQNSQPLVEVVQIPQAENSQILEEDVVVMLEDDAESIYTAFEPQPQLSGVGPSMSQESIRLPEPSPPTTTSTPQQTVSPAPRQTVPPAPRRRRRRVQRSPRLVNSSEYDAMHEASARLDAMERASAEATREHAQATREHAQATNRLAAALEAVAERLREPIIIVLQNPPQA